MIYRGNCANHPTKRIRTRYSNYKVEAEQQLKKNNYNQGAQLES